MQSEHEHDMHSLTKQMQALSTSVQQLQNGMSSLNIMTAMLTATQQQQEGPLSPTPTGQQQQVPVSTPGINTVK